MKSNDSTFVIENLSAETFNEALNLVNDYFQLSENENPELELRESISPGSFSNELAKYGILNPIYWVMKQDGKVIGLSGIYNAPEDKEDSVWGGWTVFNNDVMNSISCCKIALMAHQLKEAYQTGKTFFRLYTSTLPSESQANRLYDKIECHVYKREAVTDGSYEVLYREFDLSYGFQKYCYPLIKRLNLFA